MITKFILTVFAACFLTGGLLYLSKPKKIMEFHENFRRVFLNDAYVSLNRRKIGSVLILIGVVLWGVAWFDR
ncbi:MAG: hypothetical protein HY401_02520 [Elusimicrobia bacterium]|nr:hypothetical protein [Elusimicrobiota bacterium]